MTKNEKELLLKDLSARLPYGVRAYYNDYNSDYEIESIKIISYGDYKTGSIHLDMIDSTKIVGIDEIKPYLFPLDKINGDMWSEYLATCVGGNASFPTLKSFEWCDEHHVDYRGLIPMGLANDATGLNIY